MRHRTQLARVAALYDIHGNLPALEAVIRDVEREVPDLIVVGGDMASGPMPQETLDYLLALQEPALFIRGNCDRDLVRLCDRVPLPEDTPTAKDIWEHCQEWV